MNLDDIFGQLARGELSQIFAGDSDKGTIIKESRKKIAASVSLGLTELHKRFLLKERSVIIELVEGQETYLITSEFAQSNTDSEEPNKYINDLGNPFTDDIMGIERVYDAEGNEVELNNVDNPLSVRTISYNAVNIPADLNTTAVKIVYRANHPPLSMTYVEVYPPKVEIDLPVSHLEALLLYVASRVLNPIGLRSAEFHEGNNYALKFEQACARLDQLNLRVDTVVNNDRLSRNGWV